MSAARDLPDLPALRAHLLRDRDGDGLPDALHAPVWVARGAGPADVDAGVAAAAELLVPLAEGVLVLEVDARPWDAPGCGFAIAPEPLAAGLDPAAPFRRTADGVVVHAADAAALAAALAAVLGRGDPAPPPAAAGRPRGLGALLHGDDGAPGATPFAGRRDHPQRLVGGFAPGGGVPEALGVALRFALAGLATPERVAVAPDAAALRTGLDPTVPPGTWSLRRRPGPGVRAELVGHDAPALAAGCRWFAAGALAAPDGQRFDDLEAALTVLARGTTRFGRLAAAAVAADAARARGAAPRAVALASPPASAPLALGLPVANSARDGAPRVWLLEEAWEGERLVAAAERLVAGAAGRPVEVAGGAAPPDPRWRLEAFASETLAVREGLRERLRDAARTLPGAVEVLPVRHALRPALHWLLEEVVPAAPQGGRALEVAVGRQPERFGPADRWRRELYPVAELIERRHPGLDVTIALLDAVEDAPTYRATFRDAYGAALARHELAPPVAALATPAGGEALVVGGGVRLDRTRGGEGRATEDLVAEDLVSEERVATDAEVFWRWFAGEVLPALVADLDPEAAPMLQEIAVVASLSEPDDVLPIDHETDSMLEALHEEVYFGVLEAVDRAFGREPRRPWSVGRVLPFFRAAPRAPLRATVRARRPGSERLAVRTRDGELEVAALDDVRVLVDEVAGRGAEVATLVLDVVGAPDERAAARARLRWSAGRPEAPFPDGVVVRLAEDPDEPEGAASGRPRRGSVPVRAATPLPAPPAPLPERPLHPHEVVAYARRWAARHPAARVATPRATALGQPLVVVEVAHPRHPAASRARASAARPTLFVSARQHANEATSTQAVLRWLDVWWRDPSLHGRANLVLHPLENPDGARLHAACTALAPNHMHHAARFTAFGADLHHHPRVRGATIAESLMHVDAARRWRPVAHLNDHGYPAHAWLRPLTGFVPHGYADWSLPIGHLTILLTHDGDEAAAAALRATLAEAVAAALAADADVRDHSVAQVERGGRYRPAAATPFTFLDGLPFWLDHRPRVARVDAAASVDPEAGVAGGDAPAVDRLAPRVTLVTEVPDETVHGADWARCVRAHQAVDDAVARALLDAFARA